MTTQISAKLNKIILQKFRALLIKYPDYSILYEVVRKLVDFKAVKSHYVTSY